VRSGQKRRSASSESSAFSRAPNRAYDTDKLRFAHEGPLANAAVQEYGAHDVVPGVGGEPHGYLEFAMADGSKAYMRWVIQVVFVPGPDRKPKLVNNGVWQVVGGTGKLEKLKGAGTFRLLFPSPNERRFVMEGELVQ
jgi:hypothetical protein